MHGENVFLCALISIWDCQGYKSIPQVIIIEEAENKDEELIFPLSSNSALHFVVYALVYTV